MGQTYDEIRNNQDKIRNLFIAKLKEMNIPASKAAELTGLNSNTIYSFIKNDREASFKTLSTIINFLGDSVGQIKLE